MNHMTATIIVSEYDYLQMLRTPLRPMKIGSRLFYKYKKICGLSVYFPELLKGAKTYVTLPQCQ